MTVSELKTHLDDYSPDAEVLAFDGDEERYMPVTGFLYDPPMYGVSGKLELQTDEP